MKSTPRKNNWKSLLGTEGFGWLWLALLVNGFLILFTTNATFQAFPLSPDEYTYQLSAQLFSQAKLSVPSPQPPGFFDTLNFINNGTYYGKYSPGWPVLFALGLRWGLGWLVNPFFGLLTLVILFLLARTLFSPALANITMMLTLACPYFIFNSSCLMPHASCLLLLTLAAYFLLATDGNFSSYLGLGMTGGYAFLIRPYTALLFLFPLILYSVWTAVRRRDVKVLKGLLLGSLPVFAAFMAIFLFYNYAQTGQPFLQPYLVYNPSDKLGFFYHTWNEYLERLNQNILNRLTDWTLWTSGLPLLLGLFLIRGKAENPVFQKGLIFSAPALCLLVGYYFYFGSGVTQYGPRYLYESYALILIPAAMGLLATKRWAPWVLGVLLIFNSLFFLKQTAIYQTMTEEHAKFFELASHLNNAIVFMHASNTEYSRYFLRNGLDFKGPVLLALDRGPEKNQALIRMYPDRSCYICKFQTTDLNKLFEPYNEKPATKP